MPSAKAVDVNPDELSRVYAGLAKGLHAIAQPLTVLRSALPAANEPEVEEAARKFYLDASTEQVERLCALFQGMQELLAAARNPACCAVMDFSKLLNSIAEVQEEILGASGVKVAIAVQGSIPAMFGDFERALHALSATLKIAASISANGETVELLVSSGIDSVEFVVQNARPAMKRLDASDRLTVSVAEANMRSQGGTYTVMEDPFRVTLALPAQKIESLQKRGPASEYSGSSTSLTSFARSA